MTSYSWSNNATNSYQNTFYGDTNYIGNNNISLTVVDSNSCSYSDNINILVYSLENFNLVIPANNSTNQGYSSLVLDWSDNVGATNYELQIDTTLNFTGNPQTYTTSNSTYTATLLPSKTYSWKVRASNGTVWGQWTTAWSFTTKSDQSSIQEVYFSDLKIYPNPTADKINLETNSYLLNKPYKLFDYTGKEIFSGIMKSGQVTISLKTLSSGVYLLQIGDYPQRTYKLMKE